MAFAARAEAVEELRPLADRVLELPALDEHYESRLASGAASSRALAVRVRELARRSRAGCAPARGRRRAGRGRADRRRGAGRAPGRGAGRSGRGHVSLAGALSARARAGVRAVRDPGRGRAPPPVRPHRARPRPARALPLRLAGRRAGDRAAGLPSYSRRARATRAGRRARAGRQARRRRGCWAGPRAPRLAARGARVAA